MASKCLGYFFSIMPVRNYYLTFGQETKVWGTENQSKVRFCFTYKRIFY